MDLGLRLEQSQKLLLTQKMQLSIQLLQMNSLELSKYIEKEISENPTLDISYNDTCNKEVYDYFTSPKESYGESYEEKDEVSPFNFISSKKTLKEFLYEQVNELNIKDEERIICEYIIENIDSRGYLSVSAEEISKEIKLPLYNIVKALDLVQSLEPAGIGARNITECLELQLKRKGYEDENLYIIVKDYLQYIADNKISSLAGELNIDIKTAQCYGDIIKKLEPKPSRGYFTGDDVKYIVPDATIKKIGDEFYIIMNDSIIPRISVSNEYKDIYSHGQDEKAKEYIKEKIDRALFLVKSIESRKNTIYRILEEILKIQKGYFLFGSSELKPMTLKDIAESLNLHESTISRAIKEKYILTERGTVRIKDLFTSKLSSSIGDVSSKNIKDRITIIIDKEDKTSPLSDEKISEILKEEGFTVSRRTVAKYREELDIKTSSKRKRF
ncbi:MAG: RNA polymerase factor sigma-54 [Bacillota bacterium]|nr:RNA polymerase factor sigma-54 [Bacillota bacterium]